MFFYVYADTAIGYTVRLEFAVSEDKHICLKKKIVRGRVKRRCWFGKQRWCYESLTLKSLNLIIEKIRYNRVKSLKLQSHK